MDIYVGTPMSTTHEFTPYHAYKGTSDFSSILNDMKDGNFPVGTNQPFPVNFEDEEEATFAGTLSPWTQNYSTNVVDAPRSDIIGPSSFGL